MPVGPPEKVGARVRIDIKPFGADEQLPEIKHEPQPGLRKGGGWISEPDELNTDAPSDAFREAIRKFNIERSVKEVQDGVELPGLRKGGGLISEPESSDVDTHEVSKALRDAIEQFRFDRTVEDLTEGGVESPGLRKGGGLVDDDLLKRRSSRTGD